MNSNKYIRVLSRVFRKKAFKLNGVEDPVEYEV